MRREVILIIVAILCGVVAFNLVMRAMQRTPKQVYTEQIQYVVAKSPIAKGAVIQESDLTYSDPASKKDVDDVSAVFLQVMDVVGLTAQEDIPEGAKVLRSSAAKGSVSSNKESLPIPEGMRAVTVSARNIQDLPELIAVGKYVDVMGYIKDKAEQKELSLIVASAAVISMESASEGASFKTAAENKIQRVQSITLALTPHEAQLFLRAMDEGPIRIVLRSAQGEKPSYQTSFGKIEIIRGVERAESITKDVTVKNKPVIQNIAEAKAE